MCVRRKITTQAAQELLEAWYADRKEVSPQIMWVDALHTFLDALSRRVWTGEGVAREHKKICGKQWLRFDAAGQVQLPWE